MSAATARGGPDLRLLPATCGAYLTVWFALVLPAPVALGCGAVCGGCGVALLVGRRRRRHGTVAAVLLVSAGAAVTAALHALALRAGPVPALARGKSQVSAELAVADDPKPIPPKLPGGDPLVLVPASLRRISARGVAPTVLRVPIVVLVIHADQPALDAWRRLLPSTELRVTGRLEPADAGSGDAAVLTVSRPPAVVAGPNAMQRAAGALRDDLRHAVAGLPADERGLVPGLVMGDTSQVPPALSAALRTTGLSYLVVASGENLAWILAAAVPLLRWIGVRGRLVYGAGALVVVGFTVLARPEPSMVRATVMALITLAAVVTGRRRGGVGLLCLATMLLLLVDPWLARQYGFALSAAATAGLFLLAPPVRGVLMAHRIRPGLAESIANTAAAELFCLPILVTLTASVALLSIPANLLVAFVVAPASLLGIVTMLGAAVYPALGTALAWVACWPAAWIASVASIGARVPGAVLAWPRGLGGSLLLLACYGAVIAAVFALRRHARWRRSSTNQPTPNGAVSPASAASPSPSSTEERSQP